MPEQTLLDFAEHGEIGGLLPPDGVNSSSVLYAFEQARVDGLAMATALQQEGVQAFQRSGTISWPASMQSAAKSW